MQNEHKHAPVKITHPPQPIKLPVSIHRCQDGGTRIKDADGINVLDCAPQHAKQIADALNPPSKPGALDYHVDYLFEYASTRRDISSETRERMDESRKAILQRMNFTAKIIVAVEGGIVQNVAFIPPGIEVEVRDFDTEGSNTPDLPEDANGDKYSPALFTHDPGAPGPPVPQHPAVIALANLLGEVENLATALEHKSPVSMIAPDVYREALKAISDYSTK